MTRAAAMGSVHRQDAAITPSHRAPDRRHGSDLRHDVVTKIAAVTAVRSTVARRDGSILPVDATHRSRPRHHSFDVCPGVTIWSDSGGALEHLQNAGFEQRNLVP